MAKTKKNSLLHGLSGSLGDLVFRQMPDGSTRVSVKADYSERMFNQEQKGHQSRFGLAVAYAREAKTGPVYAQLACETGRSAYHLALSDCLTPPVIHSVERRDGRVRVMASDDVMVTKVQVRILDGKGNPVEQGYAAQADPVNDPEGWEYIPRTEGTVEATAWDLAGNQTTAML